MKKKLLLIPALLAAALMLAGCLQFLPDGFDEEAVGANAEQAIKLMNAKNFDGLMELFAADRREELTPERFEEAFTAALDACGAFESFEDVQMTGWTDEDTEEDLGVVQAMAVYENGKLMHTLYFNIDSALEYYRLGIVPDE